MQRGHYHPQEAEQPENQERVIQPHSPTRIKHHANGCSPEHAFGGKAQTRLSGGVWRVALLVALVAYGTGCVADPQRAQSAQLFQRLVDARTTLDAGATFEDACTDVGDVETRLFGEPGLGDLRPTYNALKDAAQALHAVCGQRELLGLASADTQATREARARWQQGVERELTVACGHLRVAASALGRATPC